MKIGDGVTLVNALPFFSGLEPLVGTTAEITPAQVKEALEEGRDIALTHTDTTHGTFTFTAFSYSNQFNVVFSSDVIAYGATPNNTTYYHVELIASATGTQWNMMTAQLASLDDIPAKTSDLTNDSGFLTKVGTNDIEALAVTGSKITNGAISKEKLTTEVSAKLDKIEPYYITANANANAVDKTVAEITEAQGMGKELILVTPNAPGSSTIHQLSLATSNDISWSFSGTYSSTIYTGVISKATGELILLSYVLASSSDVVTLKNDMKTLKGSDSNKSVRTIANEELAAKLIASDADASLDTLEDIAAWIQSHPDDASAMNLAIENIEANKADKSTTYTKTEVDDKIPTTTSQLTNDSGFLTKVGTSNIDALAISEPKIANGAVTNAKLSTDLQTFITNTSTKLSGIAENANNYSLPTASSSTLGGVKVGSNISISNGTISVPTATGTQAGVTLVYPAASCTSFTSDTGTCSPLAVQKGAKQFAITRPSSTTNKAITRYSNTTGDVQNSKIIIEDVTNSKDSSKKAQVIAIPAEGNKKMVYGYCTDQVDGTSFIGGVFDASATSYPYSGGLAIGGTSGNLLWKGSKVAVTSDIPTSLKNPQSLTINNTKYDGSGAVDMTSAINALIDAKLGGIENGTY